MLFVVRPLLVRWLRVTVDTEALIIPIAGIIFGSAWISEMIGLHYILGAFLAGVIMPATVRQLLSERLELSTITILLPFFFMLTGLRTEIPLGSSVMVGTFIIATLAAVAGKFLGTALPAYWSGRSPGAWHASSGQGSDGNRCPEHPAGIRCPDRNRFHCPDWNGVSDDRPRQAGAPPAWGGREEPSGSRHP